MQCKEFLYKRDDEKHDYMASSRQGGPKAKKLYIILQGEGNFFRNERAVLWRMCRTIIQYAVTQMTKRACM